MATSMQMRSSNRGRSRGQSGRFRSTSMRRRTSRPARTTRRSRSRSRTLRARGRRNLPPRDANGRFTRRRIRRAPTRRASTRRAPTRRAPVRRRARRLPSTSIVREASRRSSAGPALVKRRWWRVDGPVDPALPDGYAYDR